MIPRFLTPIALIAGFAMQAAAGPIVLDGGFEFPAQLPNSNTNFTGSLGDGWSATQGSIDIETSGFGVRVPHSGNQFAYLDDSDTVNTVSQTLATAIGQAYSISYWVADNQPNTLGVTFGSQTLFSGTAPTNGFTLPSDYVNFTFVATATSTSTILSFTGQYLNLGSGHDNGTQLDDVSVTAVSSTVPEPATLGFTGLGCLGLLTVRRLLKTPAARARLKRYLKGAAEALIHRY